MAILWCGKCTGLINQINEQILTGKTHFYDGKFPRQIINKKASTL